MAFESLPEELHEPLVHASAQIGPERAIIALQAVLHKITPLQIIDGTLRAETIRAANGNVSGRELAERFIAKIDDRFPGTFSTGLEPVETPESVDAE